MLSFNTLKKGVETMSRLEEQLTEILLEKTPYLQPVFDTADQYLSHYYIGAGIVAQSVWNVKHGYDPAYGIGDADVIYFDPEGSLEEEQQLEKELRKELSRYPFQIDVTNEALVHQWYEEKFHIPIQPYPSIEAAVDTWPSTASAVAVQRKHPGTLKVYAPFGLKDLFGLIVRPNKCLVPEEVYVKKAAKWKKYWPKLTLLPWE
ncbi:hypothetical protein GLW03_18225 [Halobacillus halophilus]|nr:hypothetical protein [Halobacillus halophilus]